MSEMFYTYCYCCDSSDDENQCLGRVPGRWSGETCTLQAVYTTVRWNYLLNDPDVFCGDDDVLGGGY